MGLTDSHIEAPNNSDYNIVLNNDEINGSVNNFITKVISSNSNNQYSQIFRNNFNELFNEIISTEIVEDSTLPGAEQKIKITNIFAKQFFEDLTLFYQDNNDINVSYLRNTVFGHYTLLNGDPWWVEYANDSNNYEYSSVYQNLLLNDNDKNAKYVALVYFSIHSLTERIAYLITRYESWFETSINQVGELFEFIFGTKYNLSSNSSPINENYIGGYNNDLFNISWDEINQNENNYFFIDKTGELSNSYATNSYIELLNKGFRGNINVAVLNLISPTNDNDNDYSIISDIETPFLTDYQELKTFASSGWNGSSEMNYNFTKFLSVFQDSNLFMNPIVDNRENGFFGYSGNIKSGNTLNVQQVRGAQFLIHQELVSEISEYDLYIRKEIFYNDAATQKKYRAIILEENQMTNFEILKGTMPSANNQIAISMQFAKANDVKIGEQIKIGNGLFLVSGFAVDTYSFFPTADAKIPLPKSETDAIVYGTANTLSKISISNSNESSVANQLNQTFNFINTPKISNQSIEQLNFIKNKYIIFNNASSSGSSNNARLLLDQDKMKNNINAKSYFKLENFQNSNYRFNWTLYKTVFYIYSIITYVSATLIGLIALVALIVCVNKTIKANANQIGILKALGISSNSIAISYISYSIFIGLIAVPLGWIFGTSLQYPMLNLFSNYFSFDASGLLLDWMGILIAFIAFGILSAFFGYLTAYIQTNQPVLEITLNKNKWNNSKIIEFFKVRIFHESSIQVRLSLQLTSAGIKTIILLVVSVFISSFLISLGLAIPSIALYAKDNYFENVYLRNTFTLNDPIGNSPQGKDGIVFWQGQDHLTENFITNPNIQLGSGTNGEYDGYYSNPNLYTSTTNNASIVSSLQYYNDGSNYYIKTLWENAVQGNGGIDVIKAILASATNNMFFPQGVSFSLGNIDQFYAFGLNAKELSTKHGEVTQTMSDRDRIRIANKMSEGLESVIPTLLSTLFTNFDIGDSNWKESLIDLLATFAPSFIQSYINTDSRYEQFAIGMGTTTYVAGKETLATVFNAQTQNHGQIKITGLDATQNAYKISDANKDSIFFNDEEGYETIIKIQQILNNKYIDNKDINYKGLKIWDNSLKILTIPSLNNKQANASYSMKKGELYENISTTSEQVQIFSGAKDQKVSLPNGAWAYNDTDYVISSSNYSNKNGNELFQNLRTNLNPYGYEVINNNSNINYYLDPSTLQTGKYTVNLQYELNDSQSLQTYDTDYDNNGSFIANKWNGINNLAYMFGDFKYDDNGKIESSFIRPYYEYKNLELYIPVEFAIGDEIGGISAGSIDQSQDGKTINTVNYSGKVEKWLFDSLSETWSESRKMYLSQIARIVEYNNVPDSVKKSWGDEYSDKLYIQINPYDTRMTSLKNENQPNISDGMQNGDISTFTSGGFQWIIKATEGDLISVDTNADVSFGQAEKTNLKSVGTIDTYGSKLTIIDSDIANILKGWPISRAWAYDYSLFDLSTETLSRDGTFNVYDLTDFTSKKYSNNWKENSYLNYMDSDDIQSFAPHNYFNTVISNFDEPLAVTSTASMVKNGSKDGVISIYSSKETINSYGIKSYKFLSEEMAIMNEIAGVTASIAIMIIVAVSVASALLIMLVGDIYISQYKRFIVMLKSFGYSNRSIMTYVLGTVTVISLIAWFGATILIWAEMYSIILIFGKMGFAIPFGIKLWAVFVSFIIMFISYVVSLSISSRTVRKESVASIMKITSE